MNRDRWEDALSQLALTRLKEPTAISEKSRLTFLSNSLTDKRKGVYQCTCGNVKEIDKQNVKLQRTFSCGCLKLLNRGKNDTTI